MLHHIHQTSLLLLKTADECSTCFQYRVLLECKFLLMAFLLECYWSVLSVARDAVAGQKVEPVNIVELLHPRHLVTREDYRLAVPALVRTLIQKHIQSHYIPKCKNPQLAQKLIASLPLLGFLVQSQAPAGATMAEWLDCSPPTKVNRVQSPAGSLLDFRTWESCPDDAAGRRVSSWTPPKSLHSLTLHKKKTKYSVFEVAHAFCIACEGNDAIYYATVHIGKAVQCWNTESDCAQPARSVYLIFNLWVRTVDLRLHYRECIAGAEIGCNRMELQQHFTTYPFQWTGRRGLLASHLGEPGSIPGGVAPGSSHVGIGPHDAADRRVFSGISHFYRPCVPPALLCIHHTPPSSALETSLNNQICHTRKDDPKASLGMCEGTILTVSQVGRLARPAGVSHVMADDNVHTPAVDVLLLVLGQPATEQLIQRRLCLPYSWVEKRGSDKSETATHIKCVIASKRHGSEMTCSVLIALRVLMGLSVKSCKRFAQEPCLYIYVLEFQLHHYFASKRLIDHVHELVFCCSYQEVINLEGNAAAANSNDSNRMVPGNFIQFVADNLHHNVRTLDGHNTLHGLGMIAVTTPELQTCVLIASICLQVYITPDLYMPNEKVVPMLSGWKKLSERAVHEAEENSYLCNCSDVSGKRNLLVPLTSPVDRTIIVLRRRPQYTNSLPPTPSPGAQHLPHTLSLSLRQSRKFQSLALDIGCELPRTMGAPAGNGISLG
ncbi:hypothetical protein PR048_032624 [Dryococelus australis]|uniref:Uncharacterized protein n=1 Tax=Dryococelus australis TaxID=614101 RepID=A0ABQ9G3I0_9NEOP|nr:hypothetical protein PR048_032624 [Dryococelus australis]